jgi:hypothetical protein
MADASRGPNQPIGEQLKRRAFWSASLCSSFEMQLPIEMDIIALSFTRENIMRKTHRTSPILLFFLTIMLLPGLACNMLDTDAGIIHTADSGFASISKLEQFWGNGNSVTTLTYGLMLNDMKNLPCNSATKVTLKILPDNTLPENSGVPAGNLSANEFFFTTEILDPIPTFQPSSANPDIEECVDTGVNDSTLIKINGIYNISTRLLTPTYISRDGCDAKNVVLGFNEPQTPDIASGVPLQSISGTISYPGEQVSYSTSFILTQSQP